MKAVLSVVGLLVLAGVLATVVLRVLAIQPAPAPVGRAIVPTDRASGFTLGTFELIDQDGTPTTEAILDGKLTVVDFFFTHCKLYCPMMTSSMKGIQDRVSDTDTRFLSITLDPKNDTPERLREYAASYGADPDRWRFLTGPKDLIWQMASERMALAIGLDSDPEQDITLPDGSTMTNITHPRYFFLVGPDGRVLDLFRGLDLDEIDRLVDHIRRADREMARRR